MGPLLFDKASTYSVLVEYIYRSLTSACIRNQSRASYVESCLFAVLWALGADLDGDTRRPGVTVLQVEGSDAALASGQVPCRRRL
jgi:hypothetical protein